MVEYDVGQTTTTDMTNEVDDFSVSSENIDEAGSDKETYWTNQDFNEYLGYYDTIPELKKSIDALSYWTSGRGFETDPQKQLITERIIGWGEDSFQSIMENMLVVKKVNGDSFAEIIRDKESGDILNLKPLNPLRVRIVVNNQGIIIRYDEWDAKNKKVIRPLTTEQVFHLSNDRTANQIHGTSVIKACKWVIDARNEAMADWRRILHRNLAGVRIIEVDEEDDAKLAIMATRWATAINKGEVMILPKGTAGIPNIPPPVNPENWIRYLENFFYQSVGVPKIILGGSAEFTEAGAKIGYLTFEQVYMTEQRLLESDIWNQLGIKLKFERPVSLKENMNENQEKNAGQTGIQPNEVQAKTTRSE